MLSRDAGTPDPTSNPPSSRRAAAPHSVPPVLGRIGSPSLSPRDPGSARPATLNTAADPMRLLRALRRRWMLALCLGLTAAAAAGAGLWQALKPSESAFATIKIAARVQDPLGNTGEDRYGYITYVRTQTGQIKSPFVLAAAANREEVKRLNLEKRKGDVPQYLDRVVRVTSRQDDEMVQIYAYGDDPEEAAIIVNAVVQAYLKEIVEKEEAKRATDVANLEKIYNQANTRLAAKKSTLKKLGDDLNTAGSDLGKINLINLHYSLSAARSEMGAAGNELTRVRGRYEAHRALDPSKVIISEAALNEAVEADPMLKLDIARIARLKELIADLDENLTNAKNDPRYIQAVNRVKELETKIAARRVEFKKELEAKARERRKAEHDVLAGQMAAEINQLAGREKTARAEVERLSTEYLKYGKGNTEYDNLVPEVAREEHVVNDLGNRLERARYTLLAAPRISVFHEAVVVPADNKKQVFGAAMGGGGALFLVCVVVAWFEFRRRLVQSPAEVSNDVGLRVVGAVPASSDVENMINAPAEALVEGHHLLESVDAIRTLLLHNSVYEPTRVLMVTSAEAGEGKTTLASHLASSLSRAGRKTLLIDGDLRQPAVHQLFEVPIQPGFSEVMLGEVDTVDAIVPTNVDGLMVLPAGQWDREVIQALSRGGAQGVFEKLKEEFDFIVVDSHPVLATADSSQLAQSADAVILSVLQDVSHTPRVFAAAQRLADLGIRVLGAVVSGTSTDDVFTSAPATPAPLAA